MLTYVGCPVFGNEVARLFGDDIEFRSSAVEIDLAGFPATVFMLRRAGSGTSALNRARQAVGLMATGRRSMVELMASHCSAAGELADRLGLSADVRAGIQESYARWDGKGVAGDALALSARISHIAEACEVFHRTAGTDAAVQMVHARSGTHFDPAIAAAVEPDPEALFQGLDDDTVDEVLDLEPSKRPFLSDLELDQALEAIGDFCDLRCPYFAGHSRGTAELVGAAAALLHIPGAEATLARRAALVHDVGRFGVPGSLWDKPGPLTSTERERMRMHVYYVERIFNSSEPLRRIGLLAATHHERMDASGYHRAIGGAMLSLPARVLAAADAYHAMTQPRPHRGPMTAADAARELRREADEGRLDPSAVDAVLASEGQMPTRSRAGGAASLTARESDVLALLAGPAQQGHRPAAGDQPEDGGEPRRAHLHQARSHEPCRSGHARHGTRPRRAHTRRRTLSGPSGSAGSRASANPPPGSGRPLCEALPARPGGCSGGERASSSPCSPSACRRGGGADARNNQRSSR